MFLRSAMPMAAAVVVLVLGGSPVICRAGEGVAAGFGAVGAAKTSATEDGRMHSLRGGFAGDSGDLEDAGRRITQGRPVRPEGGSKNATIIPHMCAIADCEGESPVGLSKLGHSISNKEWCNAAMRGCGFVLTHMCAAEQSTSMTGRLLSFLTIFTGSCQDCVESLTKMGCILCGCTGFSGNFAAEQALGCC